MTLHRPTGPPGADARSDRDVGRHPQATNPTWPQPEARLAELQAKHAEVSDAYLRAKAEAENTRRRADEEIAKARKFAVESFAESLLPVRDSLEAAIAIAECHARADAAKACTRRCAS